NQHDPQGDKEQVKEHVDDAARQRNPLRMQLPETEGAGSVDADPDHGAAREDGDQPHHRGVYDRPEVIPRQPPAQFQEQQRLLYLDPAPADDVVHGKPTTGSAGASSVSFRKTSSSEPSSAACLRKTSSEPQLTSLPWSTMPIRPA